ncbi:hypothetical protein BJX99DRAFT_251691 [Aspergillus californicus]
MPRSSARRSGRLSGVRKKYSLDPFADQEADLNPADETSQVPQDKEDSSDEEFEVGAVEEEEEEEEEEFANDSPAEAGGAEEEEEEEEEGDENADVAVPPKGKKKGRGDQKPPKLSIPRNTKKRQPDGTLALTGEETHSRGTWNPLEHVGKSIHMQVTFGLDERDLLSVLYARDRWGRGEDSTFPTKLSLDEAQTARDYKYGSTFGVEPEVLKRESTRGWDWYYSEDLGEGFRKRQRLEPITEGEARRTFLPAAKKGKHTVLIGPADDQMVFTLDQYDIVNFGDAWGEVKGRTSKTQTQNTPDGTGSRPNRKKRQGWILNIGQRVQSLAWAPNQTGLNQYLAVAAPISNEQKELYPDPLKDYAAPAFRPSAPYPSALQLWAFKADKGGNLTKSLDMSTEPRLLLVLGADWGDLRRISWCPMPREPRDEDEKDAYKNVGLLAGVWGDGYVRVIDVKISRDPNKTDFYRVDSPVFEAKPPSTICTCVTWLSPSDIAVGCANGFVAAWSIAPPSSQPQSKESSNLFPFFYHPIHSTYVLNIASAYPTHAHLIATTSMDGETRMSSLIDHEKDKADTTRMRVGSPHITYSPWLHSFVSSDENDFVRLLTVRRFFTTLAVARLPSTVSAQATSSPWHPNILLGCTGGAVVATNPLRRLLHSKEKQWQQTWFSHSWVRGEDASSSGTSRFYDGYRAESISLLRNMMGDRKLINGTLVISIFEEETHVTALAWNPNQTCAGWACAALGCGLLRIEDVAL